MAVLLAVPSIAMALDGPHPGRDQGSTHALDQEWAAGKIAQGTGNPPESAATLAPLSEPESRRDQHSEKEKLASFFLIGIVINIVVLFAVGVWAYREWRRRG